MSVFTDRSGLVNKTVEKSCTSVFPYHDWFTFGEAIALQQPSSYPADRFKLVSSLYFAANIINSMLTANSPTWAIAL